MQNQLLRDTICAYFQAQRTNLTFSALIFSKKRFWCRNFKILSVDSESAPPLYHECQFPGKTDNFEFFRLIFRKLPNYVQYFGSYNVESVADSWVEAEMNWVELDGAGWRLKWAEWRWMKVAGGRCTVN